MAISAINLGNTFTNSNGNPVLSGASSGLDTQSLVDSLVKAQSGQVTKYEDEIKINKSQNSALSELNSLLNQFKTYANALSKPDSPDSSSNLFAYRSSSVTSNTTQAASNYLSVTVAASAATGSYKISDITQLAQETIQETGSFTLASPNVSVVTASATAGFFKAGSFTFYGETVTLSENDTLTQVANKFNAVSSNTGVKAEIVKTESGVGTNNYKLVLTGQDKGVANGFDFESTSTVTSDTSGALANIVFTTRQEAKNAEFKFNGISVSRDSNVIEDLAGGIKFNLLQNTVNQSNANITVTIAADTTSISNGITNFVNSYNNFLAFYAKQTELDPNTGQPTKDAVLFTDTTLRTVYNQLTTRAAGIVNGIANGESASLSDIGISFIDVAANGDIPAISNVLSINDTEFKTALNDDLEGIKKVFGYNAESSSSNLAVYSAADDDDINNLTINVNQNTNVYTASYVDKSGVTQTINLTKSTLGSGTAISLAAPNTSELKGLVLIYGGGGNESGITVSSTHGIASKLNDFLTDATNATTGLVITAQNLIATKNTTTQKQIDTTNDQISKKREELLTKFSALEAAISKANSALNFLNAQQLAQSG
jgi:flagellar hook-associated protein 2